MVKGISRQVIVVQSPDKKLFDEAIFIMRSDVSQQEVTDEMLLREAKQALHSEKWQLSVASGPVWAIGGALATGIVWLLTVLL